MGDVSVNGHQRAAGLGLSSRRKGHSAKRGNKNDQRDETTTRETLDKSQRPVRIEVGMSSDSR